MTNSYPPFPDDVPTAPLLQLSLRLLLAADQTEAARLFSASCALGFFYLDLRGCSAGDSILENANRLFDVGEELFQLETAEKLKYDMSNAAEKSYFGYKGLGATVVDKDGSLDRNEFWNISKDDILGLSPPLANPPIIAENKALLKSFMTESHSIVTMILTHLTKSLALVPPAPTLPSLHRLMAPSGDQVRWVKSPPQPPNDSRTALGEHTDFGSVTLLFNRLGGLQVLLPSSDKWIYVRPLPGCAIVNLGDAMVKFSAGLLRSNMHRVVAPPGKQASHTRFSLVYFSRPENVIPMRRLEGSQGVIPAAREGEVEEEISAKDWILRRATGKRVGTGTTEEMWVKSMGTERIYV